MTVDVGMLKSFVEDAGIFTLESLFQEQHILPSLRPLVKDHLLAMVANGELNYQRTVFDLSDVFWTKKVIGPVSDDMQERIGFTLAQHSSSLSTEDIALSIGIGKKSSMFNKVVRALMGMVRNGGVQGSVSEGWEMTPSQKNDFHQSQQSNYDSWRSRCEIAMKSSEPKPIPQGKQQKTESGMSNETESKSKVSMTPTEIIEKTKAVLSEHGALDQFTLYDKVGCKAGRGSYAQRLLSMIRQGWLVRAFSQEVSRGNVPQRQYKYWMRGTEHPEIPCGESIGDRLLWSLLNESGDHIFTLESLATDVFAFRNVARSKAEAIDAAAVYFAKMADHGLLHWDQCQENPGYKITDKGMEYITGDWYQSAASACSEMLTDWESEIASALTDGLKVLSEPPTEAEVKTQPEQETKKVAPKKTAVQTVTEDALRALEESTKARLARLRNIQANLDEADALEESLRKRLGSGAETLLA